MLDGYVGTYQLNERMVFTVTRDGDKLFARLTGQQPYQQHPYSDRDFFYIIVAAQLTFVAGADGKASAVVLHQNGRDQTAERVDPGWRRRSIKNGRGARTAHRNRHRFTFLRSVCRPLSQRQVRDHRDARRQSAFVQATGFGRYPVYPYTDHDFFGTIAPVQFTFVANGTDKATQLIRHRFGKDAVLNRVE